MTVLKNKREPSRVQFLQTAMDLAIHTITTVRRFPKSLTFYVSVPTADAAKSVYANLKRANSIFPTTKRELEMRVEYLKRAKAEIQVLSTEVDFAYCMMKDEMKENNVIRWYELIDQEEKLISAQIKNDKARYKHLT